MTRDDRESELARLFEAERRADEAAAPDLDPLLARPRVGRARTARIGRTLLLAAAAALAVTAGALVLLRRRETPILPDATVQLADWRSPTEFLLDTPGSDLLATVPILAPAGPSASEAVLPSITKGVSR